MKIVFVGATGFGLRCLEKVAALPGCQVVGVLTLPETFSISYRPEGIRNVLHADFRPLTEKLGVPVETLRASMTDPKIVQAFRAWGPDLIVVVGWYHLVPKALRAMAPAVGLHASLLPDYSGGAPLVWAMINGEKKTGITLFRFEDGVDSGPILGQAEEPILEADTIATLYARIEQDGIGLLDTHLPRIAMGTAVYREQDESRRRVFPQRSPDDGRIDWNWPARQVYDFVRAQTRPYPGAFSVFSDGVLRVWSSRPSPRRTRAECSAGCFDAAQDGVLAVVCGDHACLELNEVEYGGATMSGREFAMKHLKEGRHATVALG